MAEADLSVLQDGAQKALTGGEDIAAAAGQMFNELVAMNTDLVGKGGAAFARVQSTIQEHLNTIDRTMNEVGNAIITSSLNFDQSDDDNAVSIESSLGDDNVALLTQGR
ncbi:hypothetical protein FB566_1664 [Stackebrandtia endophytica]|uniref:WXG100 family type VII secretion target n=1 Tax=Stackebrandtia endophytica TaxID=1496996 RepID=A0A543AU76_9ACTN|nr:hypothetical protein [Stackebrandtia endophytica]TQL76143.1 hypothetical protein FB566_1664 [Stackebrandtia endophytica]